MNPIRFLPEWARQSAVLIAWPEPQGDFHRWFAEVENTYRAIAAAISHRETLLIACRDEPHKNRVREQLRHCDAVLERVCLLTLPYDDIWVRDTAPLAVLNEGIAELVDFRFNGWGGKYPHANDAAFGERLVATGVFASTPRKAIGFILEGGSIETDGSGTLLTTSRCLRNPNRNPGLTRTEIESRLTETLGVERILWLDHGHVEGDDTDAHIDTLARFCSVDTIAYTTCTDPTDSHYQPLRDMAAQLCEFRRRDGRPYRLVPLPIPTAIRNEERKRLPANYANFLIVNDAVLVPIYDDPADTIAIERIGTCFPDREMIPIRSAALIHQYGSLHCMTMQFPEPVPIRHP
ncbi:MAG TPA: agmatine deiminase family protein [Methylococcus sp.]|nr:agmatine deiminase family protein [Methylococcus sp.]